MHLYKLATTRHLDDVFVYKTVVVNSRRVLQNAASSSCERRQEGRKRVSEWKEILAGKLINEIKG